MESLQEGEDKAGDVEHVDKYGDNPAEVHHLRVGIKQDEQVCGEQRHLHVHLNHSEQCKVCIQGGAWLSTNLPPSKILRTKKRARVIVTNIISRVEAVFCIPLVTALMSAAMVGIGLVVVVGMGSTQTVPVSSSNTFPI